ncbi:hypothetical protein HOF40_00890 [Candidatus Parcubacteria bacterium]|jgi:hypothetical protein|nr:hypothetical protein [Candidatus Parcubacteria bacterium]MBT3948627.1 hypothetical protein [Candidatus Parcubacteria bacterium]
MSEKKFTSEEAQEVADKIGINFSEVDFELEDFRMGMDEEMEHGTHDPQTDVTGDDPVLTGKITLAHLKEFGDYYQRLEEMEHQAKKERAVE